MTETEARDLLLKDGFDALEPWAALQNWEAAPGGWRVVPTLEGWRLRIAIAGARQLCVTAVAPGGDPAVWMVPYKR